MNRRKRRVTPKEYLIIAGLLILLAWLIFLFVGIFKKEEIARHRMDEARRELKALEEREANLQATIEDLNTERGQEGSLRETYGVARPGEEVIIVVPPEEGEELEELPWWRKFLGWFGI